MSYWARSEWITCLITKQILWHYIKHRCTQEERAVFHPIARKMPSYPYDPNITVPQFTVSTAFTWMSLLCVLAVPGCFVVLIHLHKQLSKSPSKPHSGNRRLVWSNHPNRLACTNQHLGLAFQATGMLLPVLRFSKRAMQTDQVRHKSQRRC